MNEPPAHLIVEKYPKGGVMMQMNIPGMYRLCDKQGCKKYIMCPYVRCQEHRTDFAKKDTVVTEWK